MLNAISPKKIAKALTEYWSPSVIAEMDESFIKVAKVKGIYPWHIHEHEDKLFIVLKGRLHIQMENRFVDLSEGDIFVVPKGVRHQPLATNECCVMLIERKSSPRNGDSSASLKRSMPEQLQLA